MKFNYKTIMLGLVLGAVGGFAYYYFIGCRTGNCPLTGNPIISTLYGAVVGVVLGSGRKKQK